MERRSRGLFKTENRFYNLLTRSRSRSNSSNPKMQESSGAKPSSRLPSRPISSTTTATNTTITPTTPKPKKRSMLPPLPQQPQPSATRQKLHNLFDLALGRRSTSRSRSRSRPSSPQLSGDVPPLPSPNQHNDATPRPRSSFTASRSPSPTPKPLRVMNPTTDSTASTSTTASIKLPRFFSSRQSPTPDSRRPATSGGPPMLPPLPSLISGSIKRVSSLHRRSKAPDTDTHSQRNQTTEDSSLPPQITHTPPTPLKNAPAAETGGARVMYHAMKGSLDSGYRYRGATMGVVDEEGRSNKAKAKESDSHLPMPTPVPRTTNKMSTATRATKHGSFDFERPGWTSSIIQRTGSNGTATSQMRERDSTYGPGLAGVGTLQRDLSVKRAHERDEALRARERAKRHAIEVAAEKDRERERSRERERPLLSSSQRTTPNTSDHAHGSTSTHNTGKSSSMSKGTGRKALHASKTLSAGGSIARLGAQHGPFSFEPPVPSPTRSTGSTGTAHEAVITLAKGGDSKENDRLQYEKEKQKDRKILQQRGDRPPVPVPKPTIPGHRPATKGRSLDLGLGLSWAPSKVREEALLPSSTFFQRSLSNSSTLAASRSSSTHGGSNGKNPVSYASPKEGERSKLGKEVAEMFKKALDTQGYNTFKTYVHRFDAHEIPFDGPTGIVALVEHLLVTSAPNLAEDAKRRILDKFVRILLQQA